MYNIGISCQRESASLLWVQIVSGISPPVKCITESLSEEIKRPQYKAKYSLPQQQQQQQQQQQLLLLLLLLLLVRTVIILTHTVTNQQRWNTRKISQDELNPYKAVYLSRSNVLKSNVNISSLLTYIINVTVVLASYNQIIQSPLNWLNVPLFSSVLRLKYHIYSTRNNVTNFAKLNAHGMSLEVNVPKQI